MIDARQYGCQLPVTMAEAALSKVSAGVVEVLVSSEDTLQKLKGFAESNAMSSDTERVGDNWKITITKGAIRESGMEEGSAAAAKKTFLVVGSDVLGKEEEIGRVLIKAYFNTMSLTGKFPHTIFFLNAGVKLTTVDEEVAVILKDLQDVGVALYSCGTCLKFYGLESALRVGKVGSMVQVVEAAETFQVNWI